MKRQYKLFIIGAWMMLISAAPGLVYRIFFAPKLSAPPQMNQVRSPADYQLSPESKVKLATHPRQFSSSHPQQ